MKELLELINPIVKKFIDSLLKIEQERENRNDILQKEIAKTLEERKLLKSQEIENDKKLQVHQGKLNEEIERYKTLQTQLTGETTKTNKLNAELETKNGKADNTLKNAEAERNLAVMEREEQQKITQKFNNRLESLKEDDKKIEEKNRLLAEREGKVGIREKNALTDEDRNLGEKRRLEEFELDLKLRGEQIKIAEKRVKANAS